MRYGIAIVLVLLYLLIPPHTAFTAVSFELDPTAGADYGPYVTPDAEDTNAYGVRTTGGGDVDIDTFFSPSSPKDCAGYTDTAPDLALYNSEDTRFVRVFFAGIADSTLVARTGDGSWYCSDDALDTRNPSLDLKNLPASSSVYIWVGSYDGNTRVDGTLYFTTNRAYRVSNPPVGYAAIEQIAIAPNAAPDFGPEEPAGASEGLNFVNKTSSTLWLAIGYHADSGSWVATGWYELDPGELETVITGPLQGRYYYYYAESGAGRWEGEYLFWIHPKEPFNDIPDDMAASFARARGYRQQGFLQIDVGDYTGWTQGLAP